MPAESPCAAVVVIVVPATAATPVAAPMLATTKVAVDAAGAPPTRRLHVPPHAKPRGCPTARLCTPFVESVATPAAPATSPASAVLLACAVQRTSPVVPDVPPEPAAGPYADVLNEKVFGRRTVPSVEVAERVHTVPH